MEELTINITYNGMKYYSAEAIAEQQTAWYDRGKKEGFEEGKKAYGYSVNDIRTIHTDYSHIHHLWFDKGYNTGKSAGYDAGIDHGIEKTLQEDRVKEELERTKQTWYAEGKEAGKKEALADDSGVEFPTYKHGWSSGYNDGFEEGKSEGYDEGYEIGKNTVLKLEDYDKGYKVGYEAGRNDGFDECKRDSISAKEIPGEYLSRIEEARLMGYEQGRSDCIEATLQKKLLQEHIMKYGRDEHGVIMESGDDEEDGDYVGPEQPEYDKGYEEGYKDGITFLKHLWSKYP